MIKVKLEDFEKYRNKLTRYAEGLLFTKGSANIFWEECREHAKDIVQNTYLRFHKHYNDAFVNEEHLYNFLKLCLYRSYADSTKSSSKQAQYTLFKEHELSHTSPQEVLGKYTTEIQLDDTVKFLETLTEKQRGLMDKLLQGFDRCEVATQEGISKQAMQSRIEHIRKKYINYESKNN